MPRAAKANGTKSPFKAIAGKSPAGKSRATKDNVKPKGKMSSYAFFVKHEKDSGASEGLTFADFGKRCGEKWKTLGEKDKLKFGQMAEADKKRHQAEMANYVPSEVDGKKKKRVKDPNAPKRAMTAFLLFSQEERASVMQANPTFKMGEVAKELGRRWKGINPEAKNKFELMAVKEKARYDKEKGAYTQQQASGSAGAGALKGKTAPKAKKAPEPEPEEDDEEEDEDEEEEEDEEASGGDEEEDEEEDD